MDVAPSIPGVDDDRVGLKIKNNFYLRHNFLRRENLEQIFSESRSGTIAHKNQKRITAGTH